MKLRITQMIQKINLILVLHLVQNHLKSGEENEKKKLKKYERISTIKLWLQKNGFKLSLILNLHYVYKFQLKYSIKLDSSRFKSYFIYFL